MASAILAGQQALETAFDRAFGAAAARQARQFDQHAVLARLVPDEELVGGAGGVACGEPNCRRKYNLATA